MQIAEFEEILDNQIKTIRDMLVGKRDEYAGDEDVLHNFRNAANLTGETLEQALAGMMVKHTVSVYDMIATGEHFPLDKWSEKITDHLNYLILLRAIVEEKQKAWNEMVDYAEADMTFVTTGKTMSPADIVKALQHPLFRTGDLRP